MKNTTDSKGRERILSADSFYLLSQGWSLSPRVLIPLLFQVASLGPFGKLLRKLSYMVYHQLTLWVVGAVEPP